MGENRILLALFWVVSIPGAAQDAAWASDANHIVDFKAGHLSWGDPGPHSQPGGEQSVAGGVSGFADLVVDWFRGHSAWRGQGDGEAGEEIRRMQLCHQRGRCVCTFMLWFCLVVVGDGAGKGARAGTVQARRERPQEVLVT